MRWLPLELTEDMLNYNKINSSYSVIVRVKVVLKRTVVGDWRFDNLSRSHFQSLLPLRLSKCQSPTTVLFRTTFTRMIALYELLILLGSNHLQIKLTFIISHSSVCFIWKPWIWLIHLFSTCWETLMIVALLLKLKIILKFRLKK